MYLISQIYKPGRTGGRYLCNVFEVVNDILINCTSAMSDRLGLQYSKGNIVVRHGSGTGVMVISELLEKHTGVQKYNIFDVSVFK